MEQAIKRFQVHIYKFNVPPGVLTFDLEVQATQCAHRHFERSDVYKVKVWDTEKGPVIPNMPDAASLILELV